MSITALKKIVGSSKATVLVAVIALLGALVYVGKLPVENFDAALKWLVATWFIAHAGEQGAKAIANGKAPKPDAAKKPEPKSEPKSDESKE